MQSCTIPTGEPQDPGPSIDNDSVSRLDHDFDFQIVIFKVENTLFKVPRNGFNVPGTPFEAMFTLPQAQTDNIEGSSLENPIHLPGVKVDNFRSFLRILYPFIYKTVDEFDECQWIGVLNLATMWVFEEIRAKAVTQLSDFIKQKTLMERIALAREHRVAEWLRDAYLELTETTPLDFENLRPPHSINPLDRDWEADAKKWEAISRDWETLARISHLQTKVATSIISFNGAYYCYQCKMNYGAQCGRLCKCRLAAMVDEAFRGELESQGAR